MKYHQEFLQRRIRVCGERRLHSPALKGFLQESAASND